MIHSEQEECRHDDCEQSGTELAFSCIFFLMSFERQEDTWYLLSTMNPRHHIIDKNCFTHVFFRCHNKQHLFGPKEVKDRLLYLWAKYKKKYGIEIVEFIIMDNHAHLLLKVKDADSLGHFMRTVNSLIARFINSYFKRDSQAIRERYKSPIISREKYLHHTMQYIWLNRFKIGGKDPRYDRYCSASWRLNPKLARSFGGNEKDKDLFAKLLSAYDILPHVKPKNPARFVLDLLNAAFSKNYNLCDSIYENVHTIGDSEVVSYRNEWFRAFKREHVPWTSRLADV